MKQQLKTVRLQNRTENAKRKYYERLIIRNYDDLDIYRQMLSNDLSKSISRFVTFNGPNDKLDHAIPSSNVSEKGIMKMSLAKSQTTSSNPLYLLNEICADKMHRFTKHIADGREILINDVGGYHFLSKDDVILAEYYADVFERQTIHLNEESKYIVLENDLKLPDESSSFLLSKDQNFSTVFDLRGNMNVLEEILRKFKHNSGKFVYVYTTGIDVDQMYNYVKSMISCKLLNLIIHFSDTQLNNDQLQFVKYVSSIEDFSFTTNLHDSDKNAHQQAKS